MKNLRVFKNDQFGEVRTMLVNGEPWFIAKDVCNVLEIENSRKAVARLDDDEKNSVTLSDGKRGNPNMIAVNESGLYSLIMSSRKPEAKKFKKWVTSEVLPDIRKHGVYITDALMADQQKLQIVMTNYIAEKEARLLVERQVKLLEAVVEEQKPKVELWEKFCDTEGLTSIGSFAKIMLIEFNSNVLGRNDIFQYLRDKKVVNKGNVAYKKYVDRGLCVIKKTTHRVSDGKLMTFETTLLTPKGAEWLLRKIEKDSFSWVA